MPRNRTKLKNRKQDPQLDFYSEEFDPLKALTTRTPLRLPCPEAGSSKSLNQLQWEWKKEQKEKKFGSIAQQQQQVRRFEPHQLPIAAERKKVNNVLKRMESMKGPLKLLAGALKDRLRLKIVTRRGHEIRGELFGFVTAFDKNWNLTLENVCETWTRPKKIQKMFACLRNETVTETDTNTATTPQIEILNETRKSITCKRFVSQLFIRGEHIVLINPQKTID